jgi:hypothetical protein
MLQLFLPAVHLATGMVDFTPLVEVIFFGNKPGISFPCMMVIKAELGQCPLCRSKHQIGWELIASLELFLVSQLIHVHTIYIDGLPRNRVHLVALAHRAPPLTIRV